MPRWLLGIPGNEPIPASEEVGRVHDSAELRTWTYPHELTIVRDDGRVFVWNAASVAVDDGTEDSLAVAINNGGIGRYEFVSASTAVLTPVGTFAAKAIASTVAPYQSVLRGVPPYVHGYDAAPLLAELLSGVGIALFVEGDSRSTGFGVYVTNWTNVPLGGGAYPMNGVTLGAGYTGGWLKTTGAPVVAAPSVLYPPGSVLDYSLSGACELLCTSPDARVEVNPIWNRLAYGAFTAVQGPGIINPCVGYDTTANMLLRTGPNGTVAQNVAIQAWVGNSWAAPQFQRSAFFSTYAMTVGLVKKSVTIPAAADWDIAGVTGIQFDCLRGPILTVLNESITVCNDAWLERADGYGMVVHDFAIGGACVEIFVDTDKGTSVEGLFPVSAIATNIALRCGKRVPWFLIDLGTNNSNGNNQTQHEAQVEKLIAKLRSVSGFPNARILLRTAYTGLGATPTIYWQLAARAVANRVPGVICVDTYAMVWDAGGYAALNAAGYIPDNVHLNPAGRVWLESQFNSVLVGASIVPP